MQKFVCRNSIGESEMDHRDICNGQQLDRYQR